MAGISPETRDSVLQHAESLQRWRESRIRKTIDPLRVDCFVLEMLSTDLHHLVFHGALPDMSKARALDGQPYTLENYLTNIAATAMLALDHLKASETETAGDS